MSSGVCLALRQNTPGACRRWPSNNLNITYSESANSLIDNRLSYPCSNDPVNGAPFGDPFDQH